MNLPEPLHLLCKDGGVAASSSRGSRWRLFVDRLHPIRVLYNNDRLQRIDSDWFGLILCGLEFNLLCKRLRQSQRAFFHTINSLWKCSHWQLLNKGMLNTTITDECTVFPTKWMPIRQGSHKFPCETSPATWALKSISKVHTFPSNKKYMRVQFSVDLHSVKTAMISYKDLYSCLKYYYSDSILQQFNTKNDTGRRSLHWLLDHHLK